MGRFPWGTDTRSESGGPFSILAYALITIRAEVSVRVFNTSLLLAGPPSRQKASESDRGI